MKCKTKNCRNVKSSGNYCHCCIKKRYKERNPERYAYSVMKNNARRRGKQFSISFEYFKQFCHKHEYIARKGILKTGLHIDRINENSGYIEGNLQVLTNTENVKKYMSYQHDKNGKPEKFKINKSIKLDYSDSPF